MKKLFFFFLAVLAISLNFSCVDMNDPVEENSTYLLELNGVKYHNGDTVKCFVNQTFRITLLENEIATQANFIFGNSDSDASGYQAFVTYDKIGTYTLSANTGAESIKVYIVVGIMPTYEENSGEAIILISSTISGNTINAVFGLRCNTIIGVDITKVVYVSGELPGISWKDYNIDHTVVVINNISYFKWTISGPAGNYRLSWLQLKAGKTEFKYDNCNWAYSPSSKYWNTEGLFRFTTYIENGVAKIKP